jgi:hypothetical protein
MAILQEIRLKFYVVLTIPNFFVSVYISFIRNLFLFLRFYQMSYTLSFKRVLFSIAGVGVSGTAHSEASRDPTFVVYHHISRDVHTDILSIRQ